MMLIGCFALKKGNSVKAVILAGGKSSRMGADKAQLRVRGDALILHVYNALKTQANEIIVSGEHDYGLPVSVIADLDNGPAGPVGALYAVWRSLKDTTLKDTTSNEGFFTVPVDAPNIPHDLCERLYGGESAVAVAAGGMHQAFAWWRLDDLTKVFQTLDMQNSVSLKYIVRETQARQVSWADERLFYNINTPHDLRRYLAMT